MKYVAYRVVIVKLDSSCGWNVIFSKVFNNWLFCGMPVQIMLASLKGGPRVCVASLLKKIGQELKAKLRDLMDQKKR